MRLLQLGRVDRVSGKTRVIFRLNYCAPAICPQALGLYEYLCHLPFLTGIFLALLS